MYACTLTYMYVYIQRLMDVSIYMHANTLAYSVACLTMFKQKGNHA